MGELDWSEATSRDYSRYMETNLEHDHRAWARRIAADWPDAPANLTVVDVAAGPAFLLFELAPLLRSPRLVATDGSPTMIQLAHERARARGLAVEGRVCMAESLELPNASADLVVCKHFLRLAADPDAAMHEMARILKPGGRAYFVDFDAEGSWLGKRLLRAWIALTAPPVIKDNFAETMALGLPASTLPARLRAAGFHAASVVSSGVSYLVRASKS